MFLTKTKRLKKTQEFINEILNLVDQCNFQKASKVLVDFKHFVRFNGKNELDLMNFIVWKANMREASRKQDDLDLFLKTIILISLKDHGLFEKANYELAKVSCCLLWLRERQRNDEEI